MLENIALSHIIGADLKNLQDSDALSMKRFTLANQNNEFADTSQKKDELDIQPLLTSAVSTNELSLHELL